MSFPFQPKHFDNAASVFDEYFGHLAVANSAPYKRRILSIDYETFSEADLPKVGASVYARDPSTEVLMLAYSWGDSEEVKQWVPAAGEPMPDELSQAFRDPTVTISAWNAPFEMAITEHVLGIDVPRERWMDVMALSYSLSLPGKLETCGRVIGLSEDKQKMQRGKLLVRKFCKPRKPTKNKPWTRDTRETAPEEWIEFLAYNRQDVVAEKTIFKKLRKYQMPDQEWALWHLDQKINNAGIPINLRAVRKAVEIMHRTIARDMREMKRITGLQNPNSGPQLLPWLRAHGYQFLDLKKGHVQRAYDDAVKREEEAPSYDTFQEPLRSYLRARHAGHHPELTKVLELRLRVSKASVKKFPTLLLATDPDGNLRGAHQFAGAGRTWRWSGRRFQPQNLSKPSKAMEKFIHNMAPEVDENGDKLKEIERAKIGFSLLVKDIERLTVEQFWEKYDHPDNIHVNTMEALVAAVRPMVSPPEGYLLADADLSAIENVVLGWLAGDDKILRVFREGLDPYIDFATDMFGLSYEAIAEVVDSGDKSMRVTAKPGVLGCGYMLSAGEARENSQTGEIEGTGLLGYAWNMGVADFTQEMSTLSVKTFRAKFKKVVEFWYSLDDAVKATIKTGKPHTVGYLTISMRGPFMRIKLPSGRYLSYVRPKMQKRKMPWKDKEGNPVYRQSVTYEQMDMGRWKRVTTHPGKLAENVTQAVARDILAHGMMLAAKRGLDIRTHVHDQIVAVVPEYRADSDLQVLIGCMTTRPPWADDKLPLKAAGLTSPVFIKD